MSVDDIKVSPTEYYTFDYPGNHTVYMLVDITNLTSLDYMFYDSDMSSIIFTSKFNTTHIESMNYMFSSCSHLTSIDFSYFNTGNA